MLMLYSACSVTLPHRAKDSRGADAEPLPDSCAYSFKQIALNLAE
jgi:hypothetical protein